MRLRDYSLLGFVLFINGACGARTGSLDDFEDAGYFNYNGGSDSLGGSTQWVAGGSTSYGGYAASAGWYPYATGGRYPYGTGGWYPVGGSTSSCTPGYYGCQCSSGYYCVSPYSCSNGWCTYYNTATGGASYGGYSSCTQGYYGCSCLSGGYCYSPYSCLSGTCLWGGATGGSGWGGTTGCSVGSWGCACYSNGTCNSPLNCVSGYCSTIALTGGAPSFGGTSPIGGRSPVSTGGSTFRGTGGFPGIGGGTVIYPTGGRSGFGGAPISTGGTDSSAACLNSVQTCVNDSGCLAVLTCLLTYTNKCNGDLTCYLLACENTITGSSAQLALQIMQSCSTFIGAQ